METKEFKILTRKRILALIQMFSPYGILVNSSYAAEEKPQPGEPYWKLKLLPIIEGSNEWDYYYYDIDEEAPEDYTGKRYIFMELSIEECTTVTGATIYLKYDTSMMTPKMEVNVGTNKKPIWEMQDPSTVGEWAEGAWDVTAVDELETTKGYIGYEGGSNKGFIKPGTVIATFMFELADGVTIEDVAKDSISLHAGYKAPYPTGLKIKQ